MRRVLKTHEKLIFLESMAALSMPATSDPGVEAHHGGCHLNRQVNALITAAGLWTAEMDIGDMPGTVAAHLHLSGLAQPSP